MSEIAVPINIVLNDDLFDRRTESSDGLQDLDFANNRLICFINNSKYNNLFEENDYIIGCIVCNSNAIKAMNCTSNALFVCIKCLTNNVLTDESSAHSLELIVSQQFLDNYNLSVSDQQLSLKWLKESPKITKITIGIKTDHLYEAIKTDNWSQRLLEFVSNTRHKLLCRKFDIFCANNHMIVLDCEPVLQGILSLNTQIVFINISKSLNENQNSEQLMTDRNREEEFDNKVVKALNLMHFTSRLLLNPMISNSFDGIPHNLNPNSLTAIQTLTASTTFLNSLSFSFQIIILSNSPSIPDVDCENGCVFVSPNALTNKLKSESKDWVRIWLSSDDKSLKLKQRFSQIYAIDSISDENIVYISPKLWFNLQSLSERVRNQPLLQQNATLMIRKDVLLKQQIKHSPSAQLALIQSPQYSALTDFSIILNKYFTKTRYLVRNDIIAIPSRYDPSYHSKTKEISDLHWPVVYFRVSLIEGNGCLIDTNHSNLYQSGTVHSLIPSTLPSYYSPNSLFFFQSSPSPPGFGSYVNNLCDIVLPYLMPKSKTIGTVMMTGPLGAGKKTIVESMCQNWNLHLYEVRANDILGDTATTTETKLKASLSKAALYAPTVVLISNINILFNTELYDVSRFANAFSHSLFELTESHTEWPLIVIATNSEPKKFANNEFNSLFTHSLEIDCPNVEEREDILRALIGQIATSASDLDFKELAQKCVGFYWADLKALVANAIQCLFDYFNTGVICTDTSAVALSGVVLTAEHLMKALNDLQKSHFDAIGSPIVPNVKWDDIGGHEKIKSEILDTIQLPIDCPQLISLGFKRSGVLLYGPPGTGKTLLAKAAAAECSLNFLSVKGPELINMYVGQSEENVRNLFSRARKCAPAVIFFDELDSLAPNRGHSGDSGGVMDRVVSQLLAEMDGINSSNEVFVIGATNRPDLLDSALLRPGRFDRLLYVGIAEDSNSRLKILKALTKRFKLDADVQLERIESLCRPGLSGADFYSICSNALMKAIQQNIEELDNNSIEEEFCEIVVKMSDFMSVLPKMSDNSEEV